MPVISKRVGASVAVCLALGLAGSLGAPATAGAAPASYQDAISMQPQQKAQWCWAGSGNTVAALHGAVLSQTRFCQLAHGESGADCADLPGSLADPQRAFGRLGFRSPGQYVEGRIGYSALQTEVAANRPVETRIGWRSGGGHMHVVYGYDASRQWLAWGDPWPTHTRYSWSTYGWYSANPGFTWTHTLTGIQR